jgi:alpha-tubulin suppressor-like RCC1 family protein
VKIAKLADPMPYNGAMVISRSGVVWAWGNDWHDQFCQPQLGVITTPVKVPVADVTLAAGALYHTLYDSDGSVVACGSGADGQLGDGSSGPDTLTGTPVSVAGLPQGPIAALEASWGDSGVLMADGDYYDWGYNAAGQVGNDSTTDTITAVQVALPDDVDQVFQGGSYGNNGQTIALLDDGSLWEWGNNAFGQLGNYTHTTKLAPFELQSLHDRTVVEVASGGLTNYVITKNAQLWAWGSNATGELGTGSHSRSIDHPVRVPLLASQVSITAHNVVALAAPDPILLGAASVLTR